MGGITPPSHTHTPATIFMNVTIFLLLALICSFIFSDTLTAITFDELLNFEQSFTI